MRHAPSGSPNSLPAGEITAMTSSVIIGLEMALTLGAVVGFGFWELYKLRRDRNRSDGES